MKRVWVGFIFFSAIAFGASAGPLPTHTPAELSVFIKSSNAKTNLVKPASGILKHPYLVPAGPYNQLFDWDTYFMGIALSYDYVGDPLATSVEDFLEFVDNDANNTGYAPREIAPDGLWALPEMCKPFMAQAAVRASNTIGDYRWVAPWFQKLQDMMTFWENTRRGTNGLFIWYNGVESGADNNPAVSDTPSLVTEGVDLQVYIYREYLALATIAGELGQDDTQASYLGKAAQLAGLVNSKMWFQDDQMYYNLDSRTGLPVRVKTWTSFTPLWAKIATKAQAKALIENHLLSAAEFWAYNGVRTTSKTESSYDAGNGYWRGPVWIVSNYITMHGLMNYGYSAQAQDLAQKTVDLLVEDFQKTGGMNECYNPETGAPTAGGNFVSWDLLGEHILQEAQSGADPTGL
jgi:putative isomerase